MAEREVTLDLTTAELLEAQLEYLEIEEEPSISDGWLQFKRDILPSKPITISASTFRRRYDEAAQAGKFEKKNHGQNTYYRIVPAENAQPKNNK